MDETPITFTAVLTDDVLRRLADIIGNQANRLNDGYAIASDECGTMYHQLDYLLENLVNQDGEPLLWIVGRWYDDLPDDGS